MVFTFGSSQPALQSLVLTLLCFLYVLVHCVVRPMWNMAAQSLQTSLLGSLSLVALSCTVTANPSVDMDPGTRATAERLQFACGVVVPLVVFGWAHAGRAKALLYYNVVALKRIVAPTPRVL